MAADVSCDGYLERADGQGSAGSGARGDEEAGAGSGARGDGEAGTGSGARGDGESSTKGREAGAGAERTTAPVCSGEALEARVPCGGGGEGCKRGGGKMLAGYYGEKLLGIGNLGCAAAVLKFGNFVPTVKYPFSFTKFRYIQIYCIKISQGQFLYI